LRPEELLKLKGTKRAKIKKNDQVIVIAGRDKGKRGRVLAVAPVTGKVKVEGAGVIKRHQKPAGNRGGGIIDKESWLDISNVQIVDPQSGKASRVRYQIEGETKTRVAAASGHAVESK
jgi:large subunit ribosomal protein L24